MNTARKILLLLAILLFLITSSYPFVAFKLQGRLQFTSEKIEDKFHWVLFVLWSTSLWALGFLYNRLATADIIMFILSLMGIVAAVILFSDVATHFSGYGNDGEKVIYKNKTNMRKLIVERFYGAGAIGTDYYDTINIYQIMSWVRYEERFEGGKFNSSEWINYISAQKR